MAKKNNKNRGNYSGTGNNQVANKASLSEEDGKLLEKARQAMKDGALDLEEFRKLCETEIEEQLSEQREEKEKAMKAELNKKLNDYLNEYEVELNKKNAALLEENEKLTKENKELETYKSTLEKDIKEAEGNKGSKIEEAKNEAEQIITNSKKEAEDQNREILNKVDEMKKELDSRQEEIEDKELELELKDKALARKEKRLKQQETVYETANPEALLSLQNQLKVNSEQLEEVRREYEKVQVEYNKIKIMNIKVSGISLEELEKTNEQLIARVEELENKCNRFTEYELTEMKRALEAEAQYQITISNQNREIAERKAEVIKLNNSMLEYEQLKAQLDLLRTLNEHLKNELDNTKKMLESSSGEICPALTAIDIKESEDSGEDYERYLIRQEQKKDNSKITLPEIIEHVSNYAASKNKPLFYSDRDLRAFIAGLASSPMQILQGLSGTGKTSLPKIFSEAIMGEINVVAVESSWRDRNELMGYYNDFSKKFTAKEFTCDLYRAGVERYSDTPYFIVLDEMNLSRVEYYFADFLSVLEDRKQNWKIKLVDTDLRQLPTEITKEVKNVLEKDATDEAKELLALAERLYPDMRLSDEEAEKVTHNEKLMLISFLSSRNLKNAKKTRNLVGGPQHLKDGNTIIIPPNVWFIGTANRDESTFEITDKVYDRAQILNFNDRARGDRYIQQIDQKFVSYDVLMKLFDKALNSKTYTFNAEENKLINDIEHILKANFKVTFGNRILDQMNMFIPVYVAAGANSKLKQEELELEAIDYQLTNKVLRKLEYVEMNKDATVKLRKVFESNGLVLAKDFIDWKSRGDD